MKTTRLMVILLAVVFSLGLGFFNFKPARAAFNQNLLIDDGIFNNTGTMSQAGIDSWLNSFPNSCISTNNGFSAPDVTGYSPNGPVATGGFSYGSDVSAGTIIYHASQVYGLNPQVILTTMEKEEGLIDGSGTAGNPACSNLRYTAAMGYLCTDTVSPHNYSGFELYSLHGVPVTSVTGTCTESVHVAGFSRQVIVAAWQLKFDQQRSEGNMGFNVQRTNYPNSGDTWDNSDDPQTCYTHKMTPGYFQTCPGGPFATYDGLYSIDGTTVQMDNGSTAALYNYTPHFAGNQNFFSIFSGWFGDPTTPCSATSNVTSAISGSRVIAYQYSNKSPTNLAFTQLNNTGSSCAEVHVWNPGYQSWLTHIETGMKASNPTSGTLVAMDSPGNKQSGLIYVVYSGTGGNVEVHKFSPDLQTFPGYYDVSTNLGGVSATSGTFVAGDFLGRGYDQLAYILYSGSSGHVEVHLFDPTLRQAVGYYDVATNLTGVNASTGTFVAGDFFGRGYDQLAYIVYNGSGGNVEVHVFNSALTSSTLYEVPTNLGGVSATSGTFVAGDFLGRGYDQLAYVLYSGNSGYVEVHTFTPNLRQATGFQDIATDLNSFNPTQ